MKKFIIHLQLISLSEDEKPIGTEIAFTHTISVEKRGFEDWWVREVVDPVVFPDVPPKLYSGGQTAGDAIGEHIGIYLDERGLDALEDKQA